LFGLFGVKDKVSKFLFKGVKIISRVSVIANVDSDTNQKEQSADEPNRVVDNFLDEKHALFSIIRIFLSN